MPTCLFQMWEQYWIGNRDLLPSGCREVQVPGSMFGWHASCLPLILVDPGLKTQPEGVFRPGSEFKLVLSSLILPVFFHPSFTYGKGNDYMVCLVSSVFYCWWKAFVVLPELHIRAFLFFVVSTQEAIGERCFFFSPFFSFSFFIPTLSVMDLQERTTGCLFSQDEPWLSWLVGVVIKAW